MRKLIPKKKIIYETKLSKHEVFESLTDNVEQDLYSFRFNMKKPIKPYSGKLSKNEFNIKREINYKNSFLPRIKGYIQEEPPGTIIAVEMKLHTFALVL